MKKKYAYFILKNWQILTFPSNVFGVKTGLLKCFCFKNYWFSFDFLNEEVAHRNTLPISDGPVMVLWIKKKKDMNTE